MTSLRVGWLLDGLANTLQDNVSALAPSPEVSHDYCEPCRTSWLWMMCRLHSQHRYFQS